MQRAPLAARMLRCVVGPAILWICSGTVQADIHGTVVDTSTMPIAGASIHVQADPSISAVTSGVDGSFILPIPGSGTVRLAASVPYDPDRPINYLTHAISAANPSTGVQIVLTELPTLDNAAYTPPAATLCGNCHGEIFDEWSTSVHSTAAEDFWVRDLYSGDGSPGGSAGFVFLDTHDPSDSGTCATCHSPMADAFDPGNVRLNDAFASGTPAALDGVSCLACHQMHRIDGDVNAIHTLGQSEYRFPVGGPQPTERYVWGPLDDVETRFMGASHAPFFASSEFCASCHQYLAPFGQTTYEEWAASAFAVPGPNFQSCQDCHMPGRASSGPICDIGTQPTRSGTENRVHTFIGSTPTTLADNLDLTVDVMQNQGEVTVRAAITNRGAGHDFPTGVSIRNAILVITAEVAGTPLTQSFGPTVPDWADDDVPGTQPGDYAGQPGKGFAKILEGRINGTGPTVWPVLFVDAERVREKTNIPSGMTDLTEVTFQVPAGTAEGDPLRVEARLLYRRAFRALAVTKGWTATPQGGDIEIEVASQVVNTQLASTPIAIPTLHTLGLMILSLLLGALALRRLQAAR